MNHDKAFSGLESAIILIAFVVVAAIFAYTILGSGFFATQKAQTTIQQSSKEASAAMYPEGGVYGYLYNDGSANDQQLKTAQFTLSIPETGLEQDLRENTIIYTQYDKSGHTTYEPRTFTFGGLTASSTTFSVERGDTDPIMKSGERRIFSITNLLGPVPGGYFTIETKPKNGVGAFIQKTIPSGFSGGVII